MKLLVTGGMGFMGSNFIRHIYNKYPSYTIINFDALTYAGNPDNLADIERAESERGDARRYTFVHGNIADLPVAQKTIEHFQPDAIINFAAESHVDRSLVDPGEFMRSNVLGAYNLLELAKNHNITILHISTDEVYGDIKKGFSVEDDRIAPTNPYAVSKASADLMVQSYWHAHKTPVKMVRGSNNFGPYQYPEKLIPVAITSIVGGEKVPIHGTGSPRRTWIHVSDFVMGVDLVLHDGKMGNVYNISGDEFSNIEVVKSIAEYLGVKEKDAIEYVPDRPAQDSRYAPNADKIKRELGWSPKRHLKEALPDLVFWYKQNEPWWKKVKQKKSFSDHYEKQRKGDYRKS